MNIETFLKQLEDDMSAIPAEEAARKMLELGRAQDGIYSLPSNNGEISIRQSYDSMLALDLETEFDKGTQWLKACLNLDEITEEYVHLCFALGYTRIPNPYLHKVIFHRLTIDEIVPYELCDVNNGDIFLPKPESEVVAIHESYFREFEEKGWEDEDGEEIVWEKSPHNEPFEDPTMDSFFFHDFPRYWASLLITHAAINIPKQELLRGNNAFQLSIMVHDTTFLVGEVREKGFVGFGTLLKEYGDRE